MTTPKRTSVLVVDNEDVVRTMLQAALAREEYDVVSAVSAEDARRKLGVLTFEVVIADEFDILCVLVGRAPAALSPQEIARRVFDYDVNEPEARELVRWHVHHLRRKLEIDPDQPHMLKDVRGMGYKLDLA